MVKKGFEYVETDIKLSDALSYAAKAIGIKSEDITIVTLPGTGGEFKSFDGKLLSYFICDPFKTKELLEDIYNVKTPPID